MDTLVTYSLDSRVATITMDDGKANAMSPRMIAEVGAALQRAAADHAVVVLAGRPGIFSGGFDLATLGAGGPPAAAMVDAGFELAMAARELPVPVVTACTGHAVAMGLFLLLAGDYVIGAEGSWKLAANEVAIGLTMPRTAIEVLRHRLAPAAFIRALTLSEPFAPGAALAAGILDEVVPAEDLAQAARARAGQLAAGLDAGALAASKPRIRAQELAAIRAAVQADRAERSERLAGALA